MKRYETFIKLFQPLEREDGSILWETYGEDLEQVIRTPPHRIWTVMDCDGRLIITAGYHLVNRMNYIITSKSWTNESDSYRY